MLWRYQHAHSRGCCGRTVQTRQTGLPHGWGLHCQRTTGFHLSPVHGHCVTV